MPRIYTKSGFFKSDTTYNFHCENCGTVHPVTHTLEREIKASAVNALPTTEAVLAAAEQEFRSAQDRILKNAEKWIFAVDNKSARCPKCGFLPTYMINRKRTISLLVLWLIVGAGAVIPFFIPGTMSDAPGMGITLALLCFVPLLVIFWFLFRSLNPNGKILRALRSEGRTLTPPERPQITFSPVRPR